MYPSADYYPLGGGCWNDGLTCGAFHFYCNCVASGAFSDFGFRAAIPDASTTAQFPDGVDMNTSYNPTHDYCPRCSGSWEYHILSGPFMFQCNSIISDVSAGEFIGFRAVFPLRRIHQSVIPGLCYYYYKWYLLSRFKW